jgi:hypothetical protein
LRAKGAAIARQAASTLVSERRLDADEQWLEEVIVPMRDAFESRFLH